MLVSLLVVYSLITFLEQRFTLGVAATIYASLVLIATLVGALLLRSTAVGQSSWKNVWAAKLMPFSGILGSGSLLKLCVSNLLGTTILGLMGFFVARYLRHSGYSLERIGGWTIACSVEWIVLIGMMLFLVGQYSKKYYTGASGLRKFMKLISVPAIALAGSLALVVVGMPVIAFVVAMIPMAIVFVSVGPLLIIVIIAKLSGKPFRWN